MTIYVVKFKSMEFSLRPGRRRRTYKFLTLMGDHNFCLNL